MKTILYKQLVEQTPDVLMSLNEGERYAVFYRGVHVAWLNQASRATRMDSSKVREEMLQREQEYDREHPESPQLMFDAIFNKKEEKVILPRFNDLKLKGTDEEKLRILHGDTHV